MPAGPRNIASWQPTVTTIDSGSTSMPSSTSRFRAIRWWMIPLVRPYWNNVRRTAPSSYLKSSVRWRVKLRR